MSAILKTVLWSVTSTQSKAQVHSGMSITNSQTPSITSKRQNKPSQLYRSTPILLLLSSSTIRTTDAQVAPISACLDKLISKTKSKTPSKSTCPTLSWNLPTGRATLCLTQRMSSTALHGTQADGVTMSFTWRHRVMKEFKLKSRIRAPRGRKSYKQRGKYRGSWVRTSITQQMNRGISRSSVASRGIVTRARLQRRSDHLKWQPSPSSAVLRTSPRWNRRHGKVLQTLD